MKVNNICKKIFVVIVSMLIIFTNVCTVKANDDRNRYITYDDTDLTLEWNIVRSSTVRVNNSYMTVQNFSRYQNTSTFFITQHYQNDTYLSRCVLSGSNISVVDYVVLGNYGHGESVEVTDYDSTTNTYTIWVGTTANTATTSYWSKDIARIKYRPDINADSGAVVVEEKKITNLQSGAGTTSNSYRTSVAVAENDNRICIMSQFTNADADIYFMVYMLSEINNKLDTLTYDSVTLAGLGLTQKSCFHLTNEDKPNGSFQSDDIDGVGTGNKYLFLAGGKSGDNCQINQYLYTNGGNTTWVHSYIFNNTSAPSTNFLYNAEIEGIKVYEKNSVNHLYVLFKDDTTRLAKIYSYPIQ